MPSIDSKFLGQRQPSGQRVFQLLFSAEQEHYWYQLAERINEYILGRKTFSGTLQHIDAAESAVLFFSVCPWLSQKVRSHLNHLNWCVFVCVRHRQHSGSWAICGNADWTPDALFDNNWKRPCGWSFVREGLQFEVGLPIIIECENTITWTCSTWKGWHGPMMSTSP